MHSPLLGLLGLPSAIVVLCVPPAAPQADMLWPYDLPRDIKYFPGTEGLVKRGLGVQQRLASGDRPVGVQKMSSDEGAMLFLDDWIFADDEAVAGNASAPSASAVAPLRPHSACDAPTRFAARALLAARDFKCPTGTANCSSIGKPDSCCGASDTCISVADTGYGTVGCCPQGQACDGAISCDVAKGYTSCPASPNGGCCLPGYACLDVGCIVEGTSTAPSSAQPSTSSATSATAPPPPLTASSSAATCSPGWFSCPASLSGGCCRNGMQCGAGATCLSSTSSASSSAASSSSVAPSAPVRPTSNSATTSPPSTAASSVSMCPSGYYVCSAFYPVGACCRVGRDCHTTGTCISTASSSVVVSNGVTIAAPSGASFQTTAAAAQPGSCPSNWYSCPAQVGGNCCPNGYACGDRCTATAAAASTQVAGKVAPSQGSLRLDWSWVWMLLAAALGLPLGVVLA